MNSPCFAWIQWYSYFNFLSNYLSCGVWYYYYIRYIRSLPTLHSSIIHNPYLLASRWSWPHCYYHQKPCSGKSCCTEWGLGPRGSANLGQWRQPWKCVTRYRCAGVEGYNSRFLFITFSLSCTLLLWNNNLKQIRFAPKWKTFCMHRLFLKLTYFHVSSKCHASAKTERKLVLAWVSFQVFGDGISFIESSMWTETFGAKWICNERRRTHAKTQPPCAY